MFARSGALAAETGTEAPTQPAAAAKAVTSPSPAALRLLFVFLT